MAQDLNQMTNAELRQYISAHRNNEAEFRAALEVMISRRDPGSPYQPYPFDLTDPERAVQAVLAAKLRTIKSDT